MQWYDESFGTLLGEINDFYLVREPQSGLGNRFSCIILYHLDKMRGQMMKSTWLPSRRFLLQSVVVALVLTISTLVVPIRATWVLIGVIGLIGLILIWRFPHLGIILLIPAGQIIPFELGTGTETSLHAGVLLLIGLVILWVLRMLVIERRLWLVSSSATKPIWMFTVVVLLAFIAGQAPWLPLATLASVPSQMGGTAVFILSFLAFLLTAQWMKNIGHLKWLTSIFLLFGSLYILGRIVPPLGELNRDIFQPRFDGSLFWVWMVAIAGGQAVYNRSAPLPLRVALGGLAIGTLAVAYFQLNDWKSGWVPPLMTLAVLLGSYSWRLMIFLSPLTIQPLYKLINELIESDFYSFSTRLDAWIILLNVIKANPILGVGPSNYYFYTPLFPIRGYFVSFNSHSQYIDILAQTGILGLGCFVWFAIEIGKLALRLAAQVSEDGFARGYTYGAWAGLIGTLIAGFLGDWVLPFVYNVSITGMRASLLAWIFLGGLVALDQIRKRSAASAN